MRPNERLNTIDWFLTLLTEMTGKKHTYYQESDLYTLKVDGVSASTTMTGSKEFLHFVNGLWIYMTNLNKEESKHA